MKKREKKRKERKFQKNYRRPLFLFFFILVIFSVLFGIVFLKYISLTGRPVQSRGETTWRSLMFPVNWVPVDEQVIFGVNVFYDGNGTIDENGNSVSDGDARYHPYRYLHDFSYAGYHRGERKIPALLKMYN